jgi:hypothetical protein
MPGPGSGRGGPSRCGSGAGTAGVERCVRLPDLHRAVAADSPDAARRPDLVAGHEPLEPGREHAERPGHFGECHGAVDGRQLIYGRLPSASVARGTGGTR